MPNYIGIDFGTSNCVVCNLESGEPRVLRNQYGSIGKDVTPSVVALGNDGEMLYGQEAKYVRGKPSIPSVKRALGVEDQLFLGDKTYLPSDIATFLFTKLKQDAETRLQSELGEEDEWQIKKAVVTIPANSKGRQRYATKICAVNAGLEVLTLINEPTAAAMAYGIQAFEPQRILVYDFGGGTFDVTLLEAQDGFFEELASKGRRKLGGDDIDKILSDYVLGKQNEVNQRIIRENEYLYHQLRLSCEKAKIELSSQAQAKVIFGEPVPSANEFIEIRENILRTEFDTLIKDFVERTREPVKQVLEDYRNEVGDPNLKSADIVDKILLVGGTSKIPYVRGFVEKLVGKPAEPVDIIDPLTCVAQGAAIASGIIQRDESSRGRLYRVRLEHSLCIEVVNKPPVQQRIKILSDFVNASKKIRALCELLADSKKKNELLVPIRDKNHFKQLQTQLNSKLGDDFPLNGIIHLLREQNESAFIRSFLDNRDGALVGIRNLLTSPNIQTVSEERELPDFLRILLNSTLFKDFRLKPLINRTSLIPTEMEDTFSPESDYIKAVVIEIYEGDEVDIPAHENNAKLGELPVEIPKPGKKEDIKLYVKYNYGEDGILNVRVKVAMKNVPETPEKEMNIFETEG